MEAKSCKNEDTDHKLPSCGNEAVLPFYLLHQAIILCVGWLVIRWDMGILFKLLIIAVVSFPLIMIICELFVRRFNIVRFFFGMRLKKKPSATPVPRPEGTSA
jgi:glucan biosynthesis protein C